MACVRLHQGTWKADFRDQHGRRRIETPKGPFTTKAEQKRAAQELLAQRLDEVRAGRYKHGKEKPSFSQLADLWLASKVRLRATTVEDYRLEIEVYLKPYFGSRVADEVTAFDIEQFRDAIQVEVPAVILDARKMRHPHLKQPLHPGPRVINRLLTRIGGIMKYGSRHKLITGNPTLGVEKLPVAIAGEGNMIQENVLLPHELQQVIDHSVAPYRAPIMFGTYTGARKSEILGLKYSDIDWEARTARIERTYRRGAWYPPKTKAGRRVVELPEVMMDELRRMKEERSANDNDIVFCGPDGQPLDGRDLLTKGLYPALENAGIRRVRLHDLRHSFASNLLSAGWDLLTVSRLLGHANPQVTLMIYAHALPRARHGAADALARLMLEAPVPVAPSAAKSAPEPLSVQEPRAAPFGMLIPRSAAAPLNP